MQPRCLRNIRIYVP